MSSVTGFLNIDKPLGMTSHDVVAQARRGLQVTKIGHAGTLDPLATGVLVLCLGAATRLSEYVMNSTKRYQARVHLGVVTETYDSEGAVIQQTDASHVTRDDVERALTGFVGDIWQMPPMYSAVKQGGRKLYELARARKMVEVEARPVRIDALTLTDWSPPQFTLDVMCGAGTYVRSLAYDIGETLGVGAFLAGLRRTASGNFKVEDAVALETLLASDNWQRYSIPPQTALASWQNVLVDDEVVKRLGQGKALPGADLPDETLALALGQDGQLVAVLRADGGLWKPHKVFVS